MFRSATNILLAAMLLLTSCGNAQEKANSDYNESLRNDIAQMLLVGFRGTSINDSCHIVRDITQYHIGGVILFEYDVPSQSRPRNISSPTQLRKLCASLQALSPDKLLIGIDQEGGHVSRLKQNYGFPYFASAQKSAAGGSDSVRHNAALTAKTLANLGINLNFAPCVDVNTNPLCPIIGKLERSFGKKASQVTRYANIWIDEQQKQGVTACLKHFPGHGSSKADTHLGIADVSDSWQPEELEPYRQLIKTGKVRMIMTTHVFNAQIDSLMPATLSYPTLSTLLRDSLHFDGVIITDDMAMGAMTKQFSYEEMLLRAILAGADMLCLSNNGKEYDSMLVPKTIDIIFSLVASGKIPESRIRQSATRIRKLKGL